MTGDVDDFDDTDIPEGLKTSPDRKRKFILFGSIGALLLIILLSVFACQPRKGSILYGICSAYLEQQIPYPETIRHGRVEQYPKAVRIYYTHIDAFGQYQLEMIECSFIQDPVKGAQIEKILHNRDEVDQEKIRKFNISLSAVMAGEPDLTLPPPMAHALRGLKID